VAAPERMRVLFLCTGNSCRSQMAEGWARSLHASTIDACSAGTQPQALNPLAVRAMAEVGIDIASHTSKPVEACDPETLDLVVTVCGDADETCPTFSGPVRVVHRAFDDPPRLAAGAADEEEAMVHYRRVRDEIGAFVRTLPELVRQLPPARRSDT
jgi:arsenate reductase (thioredoxin)